MPKPQRSGSGSRQDPHWKFIERVAALIERTFDKSADIRHNQMLDSLKAPGERRQCDVVVRAGPQHRRTLTIVEVQKRKRKVDLTTFDGWLEKMREVGAQHLVCVSAKGFPRSVVKRAVAIGPTVRLATLGELEQRHWAATGMTGLTFKCNDLVSLTDVELLTKRPIASQGGPLKVDEPLFTSQSGQRASLNDIARSALQFADGPRERPSGRYRVPVVTSDTFTYSGDESAGPVRLRFVVNLVVRTIEPPLEFVEYKQIGDDGALTWVMHTKVAIDGDNPRSHEIQVTFRPGPDGRLAPDLWNVTMNPGENFSAQFGGVWMHIVATKVPAQDKREHPAQ
jgi:hypothetical protein